MRYVAPEEARTKNGNLRYLCFLRILAKQNRKNPTEAEKIFWHRLKKNKYVFLRQKAKSLPLFRQRGGSEGDLNFIPPPSASPLPLVVPARLLVYLPVLQHWVLVKLQALSESQPP